MEIKIVSQGVGMTEAVIAAWLKQPGDAVNQGDVIAEIETDKATVEIEAPVAGRLGPHLAEAQAAVARLSLQPLDDERRNSAGSRIGVVSTAARSAGDFGRRLVADESGIARHGCRQRREKRDRGPARQRDV
jgi:multidrug efflux pump subunit AcrA (membrane-fusion protein)